jgi:EmrB/QacA subfamily drug resistance transporter
MPPAAQQSCDQGMARAAPAPATSAAHPRWVLVTTILASSLAFIDGSVVNVGLPAIGKSLPAGAISLAWVVNAYLLPLSALLLLGGALGDRFGRRRLLLIGVGLFAAASILCAAAPSFPVLLAGRLIQGVGAALMMPNSLAILGATFGGEARGRAVGTWAAVGAAAGAIGPLLGGWLIDTVGWRAIFLVNLPIAAGAMFACAVFVRAPPDADPQPLDLVGAALASLGLASLTWGLTEVTGAMGPTAAPLGALSVGALTMAAFLWAERRRGERAMMPLGLFGSRTFVGLTVLTFLLYGALGGLLVLVPFILIEAKGYAATAAGAALLPLPLVLSVASPIMGGLAGRIGPRWPLTIGPVVVAGGCLLAMRVGGPGSYWTTTLPALLVISIGMAGAVAPLTTAVLASVDSRHTGVASGFNSAVARTGGLIATALLGVVLAARGAHLLAIYRIAATVGAAAALAAGAAALVWLSDARAPQR